MNRSKLFDIYPCTAGHYRSPSGLYLDSEVSSARRRGEFRTGDQTALHSAEGLRQSRSRSRRELRTGSKLLQGTCLTPERLLPPVLNVPDFKFILFFVGYNSFGEECEAAYIRNAAAGASGIRRRGHL